MSIWKLVKEYPKYEVSRHGYIRNKNTKRILKPWVVQSDYLCVSLRKNGKTYKVKPHRIVLETFVGLPPKDKNDCNHKNGIKSDNWVSNLEWCSRSENMYHAYENGLIILDRKGEKNNNAKLTENDVRNIKILLQTTSITLRQIAIQFSVSISSISEIKRGVNWSFVEV